VPKRASCVRETVFKSHGEAVVCHVGFVVDGQPYVIPTNFGRVDDTLYLHGSAASRMLCTLGEGVPVCVTVSLIDGLVLARSAFHHSVNYRSVVILGTARVVDEQSEKREALRRCTEHIMKGRWDEIREENEQEMTGTAVLALSLYRVSRKLRTV